MNDIAASPKMLTEAERTALDNQLHALKRLEDAVDAARKPIERLLKPLGEVQLEIDEQREVLLERAGVEVVGRCETCLKLLIVGDKGNRPYSDETEIVYCAEHAMTFGNLKAHWERSDPTNDDGDEAEQRIDELALVENHVARGGALTDKITETL